VIVSTEKSFLKRIEKITYESIASEQCCFYSSDTDQKKLLKTDFDVNQEWKNKRVVGYTPTISSGVSFDLEHFDQLFIYGGHGSCDYYTLYQMIFRVRQLKMGQMYLYINPMRGHYPTQTEKIEKLLENSYHDVNFCFGENYLHKKIKTGFKYDYPIKDWVYDLYVNNLVVHFQSENNFNKRVLWLLSMAMIPVHYDSSIDEKMREATKTQIRDAGKLVHEEKIAFIMSAPNLTPTEYIRLTNQPEKSVSEQMSVLKYHCTEVYQVPPEQMDTHFIEKYVSYEAVHRYQNRCQLNVVELIPQINMMLKRNIGRTSTIENTLEYFDDKHEHFELLLSYVFLCNVLGLKNLTQREIESYRVTGQDLFQTWNPYVNMMSDRIEIWTFKMRQNRSKIIRKGACFYWTNKEFLKFLNSLIGSHLGLHLRVSIKNSHDPNKCVYKLTDEFESFEIPLIDRPMGRCFLVDETPAKRPKLILKNLDRMNETSLDPEPKIKLVLRKEEPLEMEPVCTGQCLI